MTSTFDFERTPCLHKEGSGTLGAGVAITNAKISHRRIAMPNPKSTAQVAGHPIHPMLIPFPIAGFVGTFLVDIALKSSGDEFWYRMGLWLLGVALIFAALAAVAGLVDVMGDVQIRNLNDA